MIHFTLVSTDLPTQIQFVQCKWRLHRFSRARFVALVLHLLRRRMKGLAWGDKWRKRNECFGQLFVCIDGNGQQNSSLQDQCYLLLHKQLVCTSKRWILRDHRIFRFISTMVVPMEFHYLLSTNPMLRWMLCGIVGASHFDGHGHYSNFSLEERENNRPAYHKSEIYLENLPKWSALIDW